MHDDWNDEPERDRPAEIAVAIIIMFAAGWLGTVGYVAAHFALKYW